MDVEAALDDLVNDDCREPRRVLPPHRRRRLLETGVPQCYIASVHAIFTVHSENYLISESTNVDSVCADRRRCCTGDIELPACFASPRE